MKLAIVFAAVLVCALAAPVEDKDAVVEENVFNIDPEGTYKSSYQTSNGIQAVEEGVLKQGVDQENKPLSYLVRSGRINYVDADGKGHTLTWTADENGYNAQSDDIPVAPQPN